MNKPYFYLLASASLAFSAIAAHASSFDALDLSLVGTATINGPSDLLLTPSTSGAVGAAWLNTPISTTSAFSTTFSFSLNNVGGLGNADGVALVFQNEGTAALGSSGGNLGVDLPDNTTPGGAVAAEFQSFWQTYGIVQNTDANGGGFSNSNNLSAPDDVSTASLIQGTETVTYDPTSNLITQSLDLSYTINGQTTSLSRSASASFDLNALFGPTMTVGLSAATGGGTTDQTITAWSVGAVPEPGTDALILASASVIAVVHQRSRARAK